MLKIFIPCCNRPKFIGKQVASFKHFLKDEFEMIILNDGPNDFLRDSIQKECENLEIKSFATPSGLNRSGPSNAHASILNWIYHTEILKNHSEDPIMFVDSDMFMIREYSVLDSMAGFNITALPQYRGHVKYYQPNLMFINMKGLPGREQINFNPAFVEGYATDIGGSLYPYIKNNPELKIKDLIHTSHIKPENDNMHVLPEKAKLGFNPEFGIEIYESSFLHYGAASNWNVSFLSPQDFFPTKTRYVFSLIDKCISGEIVMEKNNFKFGG